MKDPISSLTHLLGAILAIPITIILIYIATQSATAWHVVSLSIFGAALLLLYSASAIYHMFTLSEHTTKILRRIDHIMIFVLIAGTYTPVCLVPLRGAWGYSLLCVVWTIAIGGIIMKSFWLDAPRWLSTGIYIFMGGMVMIAIYPLAKAVSSSALVLFLLGGLFYIFGAVIYGLKWPKLSLKWFGFHEIFHLFVMVGSAFHVVFMFKLFI